ncbi:MAG: HD domain-containing protein [Anaerovoracaceae bacterium]
MNNLDKKNRVLLLQTKLLEIINQQEKQDFQRDRALDRDETLDWERLHMASSARMAWILALEMDVDPELPACAATVHDFGRILTGKQMNHAEAGFEPVKKFLKGTNLFVDEEIEVISLAVKNHSKKTEVGTYIEEIVKDADVIDCYQYGIPFDREEKRIRYQNWLNRAK